MAAARPLLCIVDQNLKDLVGHHYAYDRACVEGGRARGFDAVCLGHVDALAVVAEGLPLRRAFSRGMWWLPEGEARAAALETANRLFLQELEAAVAGLPLGRESVVFGHMIVHGQMKAWAEFVARHAGPAGPQVVMLLRYQPAFYQGALANAAFRSLERSVAQGARLRLASDSARLSAQLERLTRLPVETFPIPHTSEGHRTAARRPDGRLRVVSLGNARDEKGVLELCDAARVLQLRGDAPELEFVLQANDPNAEIAEAVERFAADPPANTRLVREALSSEAYAELLASADIVATPYWRSIYDARTSGVFLEAVSAGKPVVCTAETWMADELAQAGAGVLVADRDPDALACALAEAARRYPELSAKALADRPKWLAFHNPARLVEVLLDGAPPAPRPQERRAAVLFPWGDPLPIPASGAANRVRLVVELLATRYDRVRVLQDADRAPAVVGRVSYETDTLLQRAERRRWFRTARAALRALGAKNGEEIYALLHLAPARDPAFLARIDEIVGWADIVFLDYPFWAEAVREACDRHGKTLVVTSHDVIADQCRSSPLLRRLTARLERRALRRADHHFALSASDAQTFARWGVPATWSPTGMDVAQLRADLPGDSRGLLNRMLGWAEADRTPILLFMGTDFRPNRLAAEWIARFADSYAQDHPGAPARFVVAGACHAPTEQGHFTALGFVDALTAHLLRRCCSLVLAPLTVGTGVSIKSVEAFASGAPMLSTTVGVRGIDDAGAGAVIEDDLGAWGERLAELLQHPQRRAELAEGAARLGAEMDFRRTYRPYLALGGVEGAAPLRPGGPDAGLERLLEAARAATRLDLPDTAQACIAAALARAPADSRALLLGATRNGGSGGARAALRAALHAGADAVAVLRAEAALSPAAAGSASVLAQAARFEVSRRQAQGAEAALRTEAWRAYHAGEDGWATALVAEVCGHWPALRRAVADYPYLLASLLARRAAEPARVEGFAREALDGGFDPFWCHRLLNEALEAQGAADAQRLETLERLLESAGADGERRRTALDIMTDFAWRRFEAGEAEPARAAATRVLERDAEAASALYLAGELEMKAGAWEAAAGLFRRAEAAGFDAGWCRTHLAEALEAAGEPGLALQAGVEALGAGPGSHRTTAADLACRLLWRAYEKGADDLVASAEQAISAGVQDGRAWYVLGEGLGRRGSAGLAVGAYDACLAAGFERYWGLRRRAEAKAAVGWDDVGDRIAAAECAGTADQRVEALAPLLDAGRPDFGAALAERVLEAGGRAPALLERAERAGWTPPSGPPPLGERVDEAWAAFGRRDYLDTLDRARAVLRLERAWPHRLAHGRYLVAECLQVLGCALPEALGHYDQALALGFDPYWVHFNRAQLRGKLGDRAGAVADLEAALAAAGDGERRLAARESLERLAPESAAA